MIGLTRTNGELCRLHPAQIQRIETAPCTLVYLEDGTKYAVAEDIDEIVRRVRECRARALAHVYRVIDAPCPTAATATPEGQPVVVRFRSRREH